MCRPQKADDFRVHRAVGQCGGHTPLSRLIPTSLFTTTYYLLIELPHLPLAERERERREIFDLERENRRALEEFLE